MRLFVDKCWIIRLVPSTVDRTDSQPPSLSRTDAGPSALRILLLGGLNKITEGCYINKRCK